MSAPDNASPKFALDDDWKRMYPELSEAFEGILQVEDFDKELVQGYLRAMAQLPSKIHQNLVKAGLTEVHIANRPVPELDSLQHLRGTAVTPNSKRIWDEVPGAYTNGVLVAGSGRTSSINTLLHEYGHAVGDLLKHNQEGELIVAFLRLRPKLIPFFANLEPMRGARELFAEGFAVYFGSGRDLVVNEFDEAFAHYLETVIEKERKK